MGSIWRGRLAIAVVAIGGVLGPAAASADTLVIAKLLEQKRYGRAAQELATLAERGNGWAQERLGILIKDAEDKLHDDETAASWLRRAADQNSGPAMLALAEYYDKGGPFERDAGEAFLWASLAEARVPDERHEAAATLRGRMAGELDPARLDALRGRVAAWRPRFEEESATPHPMLPTMPHVPLKTGTGFYVDETRIVSDYHVVEDCGWLTVGREGIAAEVVAADGIEDLAILRVERKSAEPLALSTEPLATGATLSFVGFPGKDLIARTPAIEHGKVVAPRVSGERDAFSAVSGTVTHGWSGGPVLDESGRVVGVIRRLAEKEERAASPDTPEDEASVSSTAARVLRFSAEHQVAPPLAAAGGGGPSRTAEEAAKAVVRLFCWR